MLSSQNILKETLLELIKETSTIIPDDIQKVILKSLKREVKNSSAKYALEIIKANMIMAKKKRQPLCQDTGTLLFFVSHPKGFHQTPFIKTACQAVVKATQMGHLRENSVDILTEKNNTLNLGSGHPAFHFHEYDKKSVEVRLILKGGGCENVGAQYALPHTKLMADRDLTGVRKVILDSVLKAQGMGCGPGVLGVCIGGDRSSGYMESKYQLLRTLDDINPCKIIANLEKEILSTANKLQIGPMGFGGNTTLLGVKIGLLNRLPASYFVSISYMCWAYRRQGMRINIRGKSLGYLY